MDVRAIEPPLMVDVCSGFVHYCVELGLQTKTWGMGEREVENSGFMDGASTLVAWPSIFFMRNWEVISERIQWRICGLLVCAETVDCSRIRVV